MKSAILIFAEKGVEVGKDKLGEVLERFMINKNIPLTYLHKIYFSYKENLGKTDIAAASIGQGKVLVTPLNMAMVASGIANKEK